MKYKFVCSILNLIHKMYDGIYRSTINKFRDGKMIKKEVNIDELPNEIIEEILKEYAEDIYEEFNQVAICEGKISMEDVADILQI